MAGLRQHGVVLGNRLENQPLGLTMRGSSGDNPGQVRGVGRVADLVVALENDYVAPHGRSLHNPACLRMLDSVFGFKVALDSGIAGGQRVIVRCLSIAFTESIENSLGSNASPDSRPSHPSISWCSSSPPP